MNGGGAGKKKTQSVFTTFKAMFISKEPIHKYIYVLYVNRTYFMSLCTYMNSRAFSGFQITKINKNNSFL